MTHEYFEPLFIPHDSVCIPAELYQQMRKAIDDIEFIKKTHRNNLEWVLRFGEPNELTQYALRMWIDHAERHD